MKKLNILKQIFIISLIAFQMPALRTENNNLFGQNKTVVAVIDAGTANSIAYAPKVEIVDFVYERDWKTFVELNMDAKPWLWEPGKMEIGMEKIRTDKSITIKVLQKSGKAIGFILYVYGKSVLWRENTKYGAIQEVVVSSEHRGKGYGKKLMNYAIDKLRKAGATKISLMVFEANKRARSLYEKLGFKFYLSHAHGSNNNYFYKLDLQETETF